MIISGGVGAGKTISSVRQAIIEAKKNTVLTNFTIKKLKNYYRLQQGDILQEVGEGKEKALEVNWQFWEEHKDCDIFLDEIHTLISSRNSMSRKNRKYSEWISQVRKIWGASGDQNHIDLLAKMNSNAFHKYHQELISLSNNIFLITQRVRKIDVNFRELCHIYIQCHKKVYRNDDESVVVIFQDYYFGDDNESAIDNYMMGQKPRRTWFIANPYFGRYDSYEFMKEVTI